MAAHELVELTSELWVYSSVDAAPGHSNAGVVIDADGITVIDALAAPNLARPLLDELTSRPATAGLPIRRLVLTSSHVPYCGGSGVFVLPAVYGSPQVSAHLDQPVDPESLTHMFPDLAAELIELDEVPTRAVTHTVAEGAWLSSTAVVAPVGGELTENLIVQIPEMRVVFAGAMASFGMTPMAGGGDPARWADALDNLLEWGEIIIPGHGPVGGEEEVRDLQGYLRACVTANGDPTAIGAGPWDAWPGRHYDAVNVERAHRLAQGDDAPPAALLGLRGR